LRRAIESALAQEGVSSQICVYDNASGDETCEIVSAIARENPQVRYHCHPQNIGGLANFQYALSRIETPFFSLLSDDDVLLPGF
jgi:glycosyltransferase involved in cell wall biosynthesis